MRGTPKRHVTICGGIGIIPAYAGNTSNCSLNPATSWDHPRVCGEHPAAMQAIGEVWGSSPRMRGTPPKSYQWCALSRDHPRVCGEHFSYAKWTPNTKGSSPRMRGTPVIRIRVPNRTGIIPAYAGNTLIVSFRFRKTWDHPRVCGEHEVVNAPRAVMPGSSPRMRGTHGMTEAAFRTEGIIPAYAGNTARWRHRWPLRRDHPRVCGEHDWFSGVFELPEGSSPRMRGTHAMSSRMSWRFGIIPAYAGNTFLAVSRSG